MLVEIEFRSFIFQVNDQLIYIYQQLLIKKQNLIASSNNTNVSKEDTFCLSFQLPSKLL